MKILLLTLALALATDFTEAGENKKPFFPESSTSNTQYGTNSFNVHENANTRPQVQPVQVEGQVKSVNPDHQRPSIQPAFPNQKPQVFTVDSPSRNQDDESHVVAARQLQLTSNSQGSGYQQNNREKPGTCGRTGHSYPHNTQYQNPGFRNSGPLNNNAGYYYGRRSDEEDVDARERVKREAPLASNTFGHNTYQPLSGSAGGYPAGGYAGSSGYNGNIGGGYSGGLGGGYSGGLGGGYSGGLGGGYSGGLGGGYSGWHGNGNGYSGGYGGGDRDYIGGGGGFHGGNGIPPSTTYRPGQGSGYCYRDYDCAGIKKCCGGFCSNPAVVIG